MPKADIFLPGCNSLVFEISRILTLLDGFLTFDFWVLKPDFLTERELTSQHLTQDSALQQDLLSQFLAKKILIIKKVTFEVCLDILGG